MQEGNLGAPVLFAAQDGALPEKHRQELLQAAVPAARVGAMMHQDAVDLWRFNHEIWWFNVIYG